MNANAPKMITLSCPSCGAKLEITPGLDRFACAFCGQEHIVNRTGGTISLSPVIEAIHQVKAGVDKTAAELAIVRLQKEISDLQVERQNIPLKSPPPTFHTLFFASLLVGIFFLFISVLVFFGGTDVKSSLPILLICIPIGFILLLIGGFQILQLPQKKINWKKSIALLIDDIERQIVEKQIELKRNQNLVRN